MKWLKRFFKLIVYILAFPILYSIIAIILSNITVNDNIKTNSFSSKAIYLSTNGVHLDIVIPKKNISPFLIKHLVTFKDEDYLAFGWGDENFFINTPTWGDLTFSNAFKAMFLRSSTLIHVTRYKQKKSTWVKVNLNKHQLHKLNTFISKSFKLDNSGTKVLIPDVSYADNDNFYKTHGSYSCLKTCNSWTNIAFKNSGLKAAYWTPFDFGLLNKHH